MKKYFFLFISSIVICSCSLRDTPSENLPVENASPSSEIKKDYYDQLEEDCMRLSEFERGGCTASVNWMKQNSFREALNGVCPSGSTSNMNKTIGSKRWCEQEKFVITKDGSGNTILTTPKGEKNICPPGMYPKGLEGCVKDTRKCPEGQTLTGFAGTEFCTKDLGGTSPGSGSNMNPKDDEKFLACRKAGGKYDVLHQECSGIERKSCMAIGGTYESCGSPCRHQKNVEACIEMCELYCQL